MAKRINPDVEARLLQVLEVIKDCPPYEYHWVLRTAADAVVVLTPILIWHSYLGVALAGFVVGAIRETEQYFKQDFRILMFWDRVQDISFFVIGALLVFMLLR